MDKTSGISSTENRLHQPIPKSPRWRDAFRGAGVPPADFVSRNAAENRRRAAGATKPATHLPSQHIPHRWSFFALALMILAVPIASRPQQQPAPKPAGNLYVTAFIDVLPDYTAMTTTLVQQYFAASKNDAGLVSFEALRQDGRENHMTLVEVWKSRDAFAKHEAEFDTKMFRQKLLPYLGAPYDERLNWVMPGTSLPIVSLKPIASPKTGSN